MSRLTPKWLTTAGQGLPNVATTTSAAAVKINQTQKSSNISLGHFGCFVFDFSDVVRKSEKHLPQADLSLQATNKSVGI